MKACCIWYSQLRSAWVLDVGEPADRRFDTEELAIDGSGPGSAVIKGGSSSKLSAPKSSGKLTSDSGKGLAKPRGPVFDTGQLDICPGEVL